MDIVVTGLIWDDGDDANVDHIARHDVLPDDVEDVLWNGPRFSLNRRDEGATHIMLGPNSAGRFLFAALVETRNVGFWYVVTAHWMNRRRALRLYNRW